MEHYNNKASPLALVLSQMNPVRVVPLVLLPAVELQVTVSARVSREVSACLSICHRNCLTVRCACNCVMQS